MYSQPVTNNKVSILKKTCKIYPLSFSYTQDFLPKNRCSKFPYTQFPVHTALLSDSLVSYWQYSEIWCSIIALAIDSPARLPGLSGTTPRLGEFQQLLKIMGEKHGFWHAPWRHTDFPLGQTDDWPAGRYLRYRLCRFILAMFSEMERKTYKNIHRGPSIDAWIPGLHWYQEKKMMSVGPSEG